MLPDADNEEVNESEAVMSARYRSLNRSKAVGGNLRPPEMRKD
jgi:hypothetical protein